jgi:hypothetical protein
VSAGFSEYGLSGDGMGVAGLLPGLGTGSGVVPGVPVVLGEVVVPGVPDVLGDVVVPEVSPVPVPAPLVPVAPVPAPLVPVAPVPLVVSGEVPAGAVPAGSVRLHPPSMAATNAAPNNNFDAFDIDFMLPPRSRQSWCRSRLVPTLPECDCES